MPVPDSSLTSYFLEQSHGHYWLTGTVHGYVTKRARRDYLFANAQSRSRVVDHGQVTREALLALDDEIDYREYDGDGDGHVDQLFFVARSMGNYYIAMRGADGVSTLGFSEAPGGDELDGMGLCGNCAGSFNRYQGLDPVRALIKILAHEYGHDLFNAYRWYPGHLSPIAGNRVPYVPRVDSLGERYADLTTGYALMLGIGSARHEAIKTPSMSAFERSLLTMKAPEDAAWIDCTSLQRDTTVTLRDIARTGDCARLHYEQRPAPQPPESRSRPAPKVEGLYLSNLQPTSFFSQPTISNTKVSKTCSGCRPVETGGPHDTGLLVERTAYRPDPPHRAQRDVVPSDNSLEGLLSCEQVTAGEGIEAADVFDGDLWDPDQVRELTPWTRPNSFGTTFQTDVPEPLRRAAWPSFTNFRYIDRDAATIAFDFVRDVREVDTLHVRESSWMDSGSDGLMLSGHLVVEEQAVLIIEDSVSVLVERGVRIRPGATLELRPGAELLFGPEGEVVVEGLLRGSPAALRPRSPIEGWGGLRRVGRGRVEEDLPLPDQRR
ncbi:MAG: hypothetical protein AAF624_01395 [Bacteroidota bacterium]